MSSRSVVRAVLFSESREVLLSRILNPDTGPVWLAPGGGVDPGEEPLEALHRELLEETGVEGIKFVGPLWSCITRFPFRGETITQHETFYAAFTRKFDIDDSGNPDSNESAISAEFKWWSVNDILSSADAFSPADIGWRIEQFLSRTAPFGPVDGVS